MSSKIKKQEKAAETIKKLEAENARLRKEIKDWEEWAREEYNKVKEYNLMYKYGNM